MTAGDATKQVVPGYLLSGAIEETPNPPVAQQNPSTTKNRSTPRWSNSATHSRRLSTLSETSIATPDLHGAQVDQGQTVFPKSPKTPRVDEGVEQTEAEANNPGATQSKSRALSLLERRNMRNNNNSALEVESLEINSRSPAVLDGKQSMRMFPEVPEVAAANGSVQPERQPSSGKTPRSMDHAEAQEAKKAQAFPIQGLLPAYVVDKLIGSGSSSTVHRAHDVNTGRHVALKQFTRSADDEEVLQFIREEFYILRKFHHNNIVKPIRLEEDYADASNVRVVMILEYGGSLTLTQYVQRQRTLEEGTCRGLFLQLCGAIFYLHCKKYVHRDIKPDNLVLSSTNYKDPDCIPASKGSSAMLTLKMIDFNTATCFGRSSNHMPIWLSPPVTTQEMADLVQSITHKRKLRVDYSLLLTPTGTGLYQAGEVVTGHDYTEKVDIWSAGMTMLYMLCGADVTRPQGRMRSYIRSHGKIMNGLSPECINILDEMLQPNPVARASALQCYTHSWFHTDIPRSKRKGRLQTYRAPPATSATSGGEKSTRSRKREKKSSKSNVVRSHSAPPCPTARLQLMRFEALAMHQTYVVKMDRGKGSHQELIVSLSKNIVAYGGNAMGLADEASEEIERALHNGGDSLVNPPVIPADTRWRSPKHRSVKAAGPRLGVEEEEEEEKSSTAISTKEIPNNSICSCCRRRSAKVAIQSPIEADVVIEVDAKGKGADEAFSLVPDPEPARQLTIAGQLKSSRSSEELPQSVSRWSDDALLPPKERARSYSEKNDDRAGTASDCSRRSKTSKGSKMTSDSKKYIQTCSWMFRDDTDGFAIRLNSNEGNSASFVPTQLTFNLSDIVEEGAENGSRLSAKQSPSKQPSAPFAEGNDTEVGGSALMTRDSSRSGTGGQSGFLRSSQDPFGYANMYGHTRYEASEASASLVNGSETTGSRTGASTAATNLMTSQSLKDLFNMIWSARGFRRKYARECPF